MAGLLQYRVQKPTVVRRCKWYIELLSADETSL